MLNEQELREIKADVNYSVSQLINQISALQDENNYLKRENKILRGGSEHENIQNRNKKLART